MMVHHARCPEAPLLHLPSLVSSRQSSWFPTTGLQQACVPGFAPAEEAGDMASAESRSLCRPPDPGAWRLR